MSTPKIKTFWQLFHHLIAHPLPELKACPFCGCRATCYDYWEPEEAHFPAVMLWRVRCTDCHLGGDGYRTPADAVAKWNTRPESQFEARVEALQGERDAEIRKFEEHTQAVGRFLSQMYAVMVDPLEQGDLKVAEMCEVLLGAACENRQALQDQIDRAGNLPANWKEDSSLETWFPLTAEELARTKAELATLRADHAEQIEALTALHQGIVGENK
jgi:hypothetical protein